LALHAISHEDEEEDDASLCVVLGAVLAFVCAGFILFICAFIEEDGDSLCVIDGVLCVELVSFVSARFILFIFAFNASMER